MMHPRLRSFLLDWLAPAVFLVFLYGLFAQRTWSVDGCIMTMNTDHFMDNRSYGHFLLRPVAYVWSRLARGAGVETPQGVYGALWLLFTGFGVGALTLLYNTVRLATRRRGTAWLALVAIGVARNALRQFATLDEKGLGIGLFALAIFVTAWFFRKTQKEGRDPLAPGQWPLWLAPAAAWTLAAFGHLQNVPFVLAFLAAPVFFVTSSQPLRRRAGLTGLLLVFMGVLALGLFVAIHWRVGRLDAFPLFLHDLLGKHSGELTQSAGLTPPAGLATPAGLVKRLAGAVEGWTKAYFIVDRLSPKIFLGLALGGFATLLAAMLWGAWRRRRDPLMRLTLAGCLLLMVLMPLGNSFPNFGDSYTMLTFGAFVLLGAAPWRLLAVVTGLLLIVNLPAQASFSYPPVTMRQDLRALGRVQRAADDAPWLVVEELARPDQEQEFAPYFYPMCPGLDWQNCAWDSLPPGRCLLEIPLVVERDGAADEKKLAGFEAELARRGRAFRREALWSPPRVVRSDFRAYGVYYVIEPRP